MTLFTFGMIALVATFIVPFAGLILDDTRFFGLLDARSIAHTSERLAQQKSAATVHSFPATKSTTKKAA